MKMNYSIALSKLYPQINVVRGVVAYDKDDNVVEYDKDAVQAEVDAHVYKELRANEYPPITDYLDGVVKGDQTQIAKYIADCQAVKVKYPKPT